MKPGLQQSLIWAPRILAILFALFISLFALDVLAEETGFRETIPALLIHLIPVYVVILGLVLAWKRAWIGAILFIFLAVIYPVWTGGRVHWTAYLAISVPLGVVGLLFLAGGYFQPKNRSHSRPGSGKP